MDIIDLINMGIIVSGLTIAFTGLLFAIATRIFNKWYPNYFVILFAIISVYLAFEFVVSITLQYRSPSLTNLSRFALFMSSFSSSLLMPMLSILIIKATNPRENWRNSHYMRIVSLLWCIYFVLLVITQFTKFIYYFTPDNQYQRGPFYSVLLIAPALLMLVNTIALIRRWHLLGRRQRIAFTIDIVLPLAAMIIQMIFYGILMIAFASVIAALCLFMFLIQEYVGEALSQMRINADQKASILSLQMRPHFIYNTLTSIYYLCDQDPQKAKQTVLDFSTYLRKNFTAITNDETVPFESELEHTKAYLKVEQTRFPNRITVNYETEDTDFKMPPLTLQPLVENAIKHGLDADIESLNIVICTMKLTDSVKIIVKDNGVGCVKSDSDGPGVALENIKQRLKSYCNGSLSIISPEDDKGTVATITIPIE